MFAIKLLRVVLGIGQREFSRRSGVSIRELARIEAAEVLPRRDVAQKIDRTFEQYVLERAAAAISADRLAAEPKAGA